MKKIHRLENVGENEKEEKLIRIGMIEQNKTCEPFVTVNEPFSTI